MYFPIYRKYIRQLSILSAATIQFLTTSAVYATESSIKAQQIVTMADEIRFPRTDFYVDVIVTSYNGEQKHIHKYQILSKGRDKAVVITTYPITERGQILLMKGHDLWAYMPDVSQPIRLSFAQRLTGEVANGDLTRANFSADYRAKVLKTENIDGNDYYVLELNAARQSVTYHRVIYWVGMSDYKPYKAEFYSASGRMLKTCTYTKFQPIKGKLRPTRLIMEDALRKSEKSVLDYSNLSTRKIPDKVFTKDYLKKLR